MRELTHHIHPFAKGLCESLRLGGISPGGPQLLTFLRRAREAHGQAQTFRIIIKQVIHIEGVQGFGPRAGSLEGQGHVLVCRIDAHQLLGLRQQGDKLHAQAAASQLGRAGGQHVQLAHALEGAIHERNEQFIVQALQHRANKHQFFLLPRRDFAGCHAAAAVKDELEQIVVESFAYLILNRLHSLARRGEVGVYLQQGRCRLWALTRRAVHVVDAAWSEIKPNGAQARSHAHGRVNRLVDGLERGDAHLLQHAAVGQGVHGGRAPVHIVARHIPARAKAREGTKARNLECMAVAVAPFQPVDGSNWHAACVYQPVLRVFTRVHSLNDVAPLLGIAARRLAQGFGQGRRAESLNDLAQGHGAAAEHRVHPSRCIAVQRIFTRAEGDKTEPVLWISKLKHKGRAKGAQFAIHGVHGIVEV